MGMAGPGAGVWGVSHVLFGRRRRSAQRLCAWPSCAWATPAG